MGLLDTKQDRDGTSEVRPVPTIFNVVTRL